MATFTVELRKIIKPTLEIGLADYPIFDDGHRIILNNKIIDHYRYREIGFETVDMFVDRLRERMTIMMPAFNEIYLTTLMSFDPLTTTKIVTDHEGTAAEQSTGTTTASGTAANASDTTASGRNVSSDFPQSMLNDSGDYATAANDSVSASGVTSTGENTSAQESEQGGTRENASHTTMEGYTMSPSELLLRYRDTIINVDAGVVAGLSDLFMGVWNTGDEYGNYQHSTNGHLYSFNQYGGF